MNQFYKHEKVRYLVVSSELILDFLSGDSVYIKISYESFFIPIRVKCPMSDEMYHLTCPKLFSW